jgi:hypothetical protein
MTARLQQPLDAFPIGAAWELDIGVYGASTAEPITLASLYSGAEWVMTRQRPQGVALTAADIITLTTGAGLTFAGSKVQLRRTHTQTAAVLAGTWELEFRLTRLSDGVKESWISGLVPVGSGAASHSAGSAAGSPRLTGGGAQGLNLFTGIHEVQVLTGIRPAVIADVAGLQTALDAKADEAFTVTGGGLATGGGDLTANRTITVTAATLAEAQAGTASGVVLTPQLGTDLLNARRGAAGGVASLDGAGLIPTTQLPALAITDTFPVANQAAMLALTAEKGDVAIRADNGKSYVLATNSPSTLGDWLELTATGAVQTVAGRVGNVVLAIADVVNLTASLAAKADLAGATMAGVLAFVAGTAALPGLAVAGDLNTGIYGVSADVLGVSAGGVQVQSWGVGTSTLTGHLLRGADNTYDDGALGARIRSGYFGTNVVIGYSTTSTAQLHVGAGGDLTVPNGAGTSVTPQVTNSQTSGYAMSAVVVHDGTFNPRAGLFVDLTNSLWGLSGTVSSTPLSFVLRNNGTEVLRATAAGYLGIGVNPATSLHVRTPTTIYEAARFDATDTSVYTSWAIANTRFAYIGSASQMTDGGATTALAIRSDNILYFASGGSTRRWQMEGSGHFIPQADATYDVGYATANRVRNIYTSAGVYSTNFVMTNGAGSTVYGRLTGISDGIFKLTNSADTGFTRLNFGPVSVSGVALKVNGAGLQVRKGDDSGMGAFEAASADIYGNIRALTDAAAITIGAATDVVWVREAAGSTGFRNGTNAQLLYVYNTSANGNVDFERTQIGWSSNTFYIRTQAGGAGSTRNISLIAGTNLFLGGGGLTSWVTGSTGHWLPNADATYDFGSAANQIRDAFLSRYMKIGGAAPAGAAALGPTIQAFGSLTAFIGGNVLTDATDKVMRFGMLHYLAAEKPIAMIYGIGTATTNTVFIGGGTSAMNAATDVLIYTGATNATPTGTSRWGWNSAGNYLPQVDATYDAGSTSFRIRNGFFGTGLFVGTGTASSVPIAGGSNFTPQLANTQASGTSAIGVALVDGVNNRRAGLFVSDTTGLWGISHTYSGTVLPFVIITGSTERFRLDVNGNFGMGVSTVTSGVRLEVAGRIKLGNGAATNTAYLMVNTASGTAAGIQLFQDGVESWVISSPASSTSLEITASGSTRLSMTTNGVLSLYNNLLFSVDNTYDVGGGGTNRPRNVYAAGSIVAGAAASFALSGRSGITSSADGIMGLVNNAGTSFTRLNLGPASASFVALKLNAAALDIKIGDDTAYANLRVLGLTVGTAAAMLTSSVAMTDGAGVAAGTLLNAPAAGNPTKWIPINDNGTTRYIPAW